MRLIRMNKFFFISRLFLFVLILSVYTPGGPLNGNYSSYGLPLSIFYDPSLLSDQVGYPAGFQFRLNSERKMDAQGSFIVPLDNSGLSFGYQNEKGTAVVSSGFGHGTGLLDFGSTFSFHFINKQPQLSVRAAFSKSLNKQRVSFITENIVVSERDSSLSAGFRLNINGPFLHYKNLLSYDFSFYSYLNKEFNGVSDIGGICRINFSSKKAPMIDVSSGFEIRHKHRTGFELRYFLSLGAFTFLKPSLAGIYAGYERMHESSQEDLYGAFYFNPFEKMDRSSPEVALKYKKNEKRGYYFAISCEDESNGSGIKNWVLVISALKKKNGHIIKTFSGGSVAPSVIRWDGKNSEGARVTQEKVYVKLTAVDKADNMASTEWKKIKIDE